jgi:hypothetical protein
MDEQNIKERIPTTIRTMICEDPEFGNVKLHLSSFGSCSRFSKFIHEVAAV